MRRRKRRDQPVQQPALPALPAEYPQLLARLKERIQSALLRASLSLNRERLMLYWDLGRAILMRQREQGWGTKVIDRLSADLTAAFPGTEGFSPRSLKYMRAFAEAYPDPAIVQQLLHNCPWGHHVVLLNRLSSREERLWYAAQTVEHGWSRNVLCHHIEADLYRRHARAVTNFATTLPAPQSDLAQELTRGHYNFDFLLLSRQAAERDVERGLIAHFRDFFRELGTGFAFLGSQYRLDVGQSEFFPDLLFYHTKLHSYVVIEIKVESFAAAHVGQMALYVEAIDRQLRHPALDGPTIGIILCKTKDDVVVEYTLSGVAKPVGVGTYQHRTRLPDTVVAQLPDPKALQREFAVAEKQLRGRGTGSRRRMGGRQV